MASAVEFLTGTRDKRLESVTLALAAEMLMSSGIATSIHEAALVSRTALDNGDAAEVFGRMVSALGGPSDFVENYRRHLPAAEVEFAVKADRAGYVAAVETRDVGIAVVAMGGGRTDPGAAIDHAVGFTRLPPVGSQVAAGDALALVHARSQAQAQEAAQAIRRAYLIEDKRPSVQRPVRRRVVADG